ncbi:MAG: DUF4405 domain-containing protein [Schwartzia sp.]|nr:DUF4405 domain-containing protein [Schwartzia sp. (in: firmicutes)]
MKRMVLDGLLFALLVLLMAFQPLPKPLHEAMGVGMGALALLHLAWNGQWFSSLGRGKWNLRRAVSCFVNVALTVSFAVALVSGLAIAGHLFTGVFGPAWQKSILTHQAHIASSYWLLIFSGLHLGLHWTGLWSRFVRWRGWDVSSRGYRMGTRLATAAIFAGGVVGSFLHRIGDRLMMKHFFGTAATKLPLAAFLLVIVAIFGMYAVLGNKLQKRV